MSKAEEVIMLNSVELQKRIDALEVKYQAERKRYWKHMTVFLGIFCLIMALLIALSLIFIDSSWIQNLQNANASNTKNIDYLQFVIPILLTVGGFFVAFLGMNRLKDIDTQVDKMRESLHQELSVEKKQLSELRSEMFQNINFEKNEMQSHRQVLAESIDQRIEIKTNAFRDTIKDELQEEQNKLLESLKSCQEESIETVNNAFSLISKEIGDFKDQYGWLVSSNKQNIETILISISTVNDAHERIETLFATKQRPQNIMEIVKHIVDDVVQKHIQGDDDYHNLAAELARQNLYQDACMICEAGVYYFDNNVDLLSDWIQYGTKIGDYDNVKGALQKLIAIPKNLWKWRAFEFTINYYIAVSALAEADDVANEFIKWLPNEERAYYFQALVYQNQYGGQESVNKVIETLQIAIDLNLNCPMCANRLAVIYSDIGNLKEALACANLAIRELAQEQPSLNYAYVFYRRALICDRLFFQRILSDPINDDEEETLNFAISSYQDYMIAINSREMNYVTLIQAQTRKKLIEKYIPDELVQKGANDAQPFDLETILMDAISQHKAQSDIDVEL